MASNTPKLGLLKKDPVTDGNDTFNIKTMLNDNWDKIDEAVETIEESITNINVPVMSVNDKTGEVVLNANDVGAETPSGAQAKANAAASAALSAANDYTDQEVDNTKGLIGTLSNLATTIKTNLVAAINEIFNDLKSHKAESATEDKLGHVKIGDGLELSEGIISVGRATSLKDGLMSKEDKVKVNEGKMWRLIEDIVLSANTAKIDIIFPKDYMEYRVLLKGVDLTRIDANASSIYLKVNDIIDADLYDGFGLGNTTSLNKSRGIRITGSSATNDKMIFPLGDLIIKKNSSNLYGVLIETVVVSDNLNNSNDAIIQCCYFTCKIEASGFQKISLELDNRSFVSGTRFEIWGR